MRQWKRSAKPAPASSFHSRPASRADRRAEGCNNSLFSGNATVKKTIVEATEEAAESSHSHPRRRPQYIAGFVYLIALQSCVHRPLRVSHTVQGGIEAVAIDDTGAIYRRSVVFWNGHAETGDCGIYAGTASTLVVCARPETVAVIRQLLIVAIYARARGEKPEALPRGENAAAHSQK